MPSRSLQTLAERLERRWRYIEEAGWDSLGIAMQSYYGLLRESDALSAINRELQATMPEFKVQFDKYFAPQSETPKLRPGDDAVRPQPAQRPLMDVRFSYAAWAVSLMAAVDTYFQLAVGQDGSAACRRVASRLPMLIEDAGTASRSNDVQAIEPREARTYRAMVNGKLRPLHEYLLDALDTNVETLAAMRWFQHWAQWFGASRFEWERRLEDEAVKAGKGKREYEKRFQLVLFEKLFEYGLHLDLSREPKTNKGSPDFTFIQRTATGPRPIVVEAKILDKATDPKAALGNLQIRQYMDGLHADTGYLVLFDMSLEGHRVELDHRLDGLPYLLMADGRQVYVIHAPIVAQTPASRGHPTTLDIKSFAFKNKKKSRSSPNPSRSTPRLKAPP